MADVSEQVTTVLSIFNFKCTKMYKVNDSDIIEYK